MYIKKKMFIWHTHTYGDVGWNTQYLYLVRPSSLQPICLAAPFPVHCALVRYGGENVLLWPKPSSLQSFLGPWSQEALFRYLVYSFTHLTQIFWVTEQLLKIIRYVYSPSALDAWSSNPLCPLKNNFCRSPQDSSRDLLYWLPHTAKPEGFWILKRYNFPCI